MSETCCGGVEQPAEQAPEPSISGVREVLRTPGVFVSGLFLVAGAVSPYFGLDVLSMAAYAVAVAFAVPVPARRAMASLRARVLDINVLMVVAVTGAAMLGDWREAAVVVWLFGVAQWLEARSLARARRAIGDLVGMAPRTATVRRDGRDHDVPAREVRVGDVVIVRPGDHVPVDGLVLMGESAVNQAPVTGESLPVDKFPGTRVFAGSVNGPGALDVEATTIASDSTLARIIQLVESAREGRAPIQTFVDRFARRYTPAVVILAVLVAVVPPVVALVWGAGDQTFAAWSYRALALLVVACPCALVISTPVSIISALTAAAREGVLIKGGSPLERLSAVRCIAFDKTGTITEGRVVVSHVMALEGASRERVLSVAAALESRSEHPIGRAIVSHAKAEGLEIRSGDGFRALPGLGAEANVGHRPAVVGNHRLFESLDLCTDALHAGLDEMERRGGQPVLVSHDGAPLGIIGVSDELRATGRQVVTDLRDEGIDRVVLLTGDREAAASVVGTSVGLDESHANLLPADKVGHVLRLKGDYGPVAMVGDGINDAPALAAADVGIAMGITGTHAALHTADVALLSDDLTKLPYAFRLGRATLANIRVNVGIALGFKLVFVGLAASGFATLWMAVLADTGASLIVTANSLRLLRVK